MSVIWKASILTLIKMFLRFLILFSVRKLVTNLVTAIEQSSQGNAVSVNPRIAAIARKFMFIVGL